jgi:hypothetical protein
LLKIICFSFFAKVYCKTLNWKETFDLQNHSLAGGGKLGFLHGANNLAGDFAQGVAWSTHRVSNQTERWTIFGGV